MGAAHCGTDSGSGSIIAPDSDAYVLDSVANAHDASRSDISATTDASLGDSAADGSDAIDPTFVGCPVRGSWTDPATGLMWQNPPSCERFCARAEANCMALDVDGANYCDGVTWDGFTDWRLPTLNELRTLIRGNSDTVTGGSCGLTDTCLSNQWAECGVSDCGGGEIGGGPANGCYWAASLLGPCDVYWSASRAADPSLHNFAVWFEFGAIGSPLGLPWGSPVRCVR